MFQHYYTKDHVPLGSVVYTDCNYVVKELSERKDLLVVPDFEKTCGKLEEAILASFMIRGYTIIVVGVDPGSTLSYVFLGDDHLIFYGEGGLKELEDDLTYVFNCIPSGRVKIKVGASSESVKIVEALRRKFKAVTIELVDEAKTSPSKDRVDTICSSRELRGLKPFRFRDIYAAYRIALSKGVEVF